MPTPEELVERMDRLDSRVTHQEVMFLSEVKDINAKLTAMAVSNAQRRDCPEPGACLRLAPEITRLTAIVADHDKRIQAVEKWQSGLIAVFGLLMVLLTLFGPTLRAAMHLP